MPAAAHAPTADVTPGHDLERDARFREDLGLLAAAAEHARVAALQPAHRLALAGEPHERVVDRFLSRGADAVAALADGHEFRVRAGFGEQVRGR